MLAQGLLVSCYRRREREAASEVWYLMRVRLGDQNSECKLTGVPGLVVATTSANPIDVVRKLRELAQEDREDFKYTLKYVPIEMVVDARIEGIVEGTKKLIHKIRPDETFRITLNRRHTALERTVIIDAVAAIIDRKVSLSEPDKILRIEIVKTWAGLAVLQIGDVLSLSEIATNG